MTQFEPVSLGYLRNRKEIKKHQITGNAYVTLNDFINDVFRDKKFPKVRKYEYKKRKRRKLTVTRGGV